MWLLYHPWFPIEYDISTGISTLCWVISFNIFLCKDIKYKKHFPPNFEFREGNCNFVLWSYKNIDQSIWHNSLPREGPRWGWEEKSRGGGEEKGSGLPEVRVSVGVLAGEDYSWFLASNHFWRLFPFLFTVEGGLWVALGVCHPGECPGFSGFWVTLLVIETRERNTVSTNFTDFLISTASWPCFLASW